jgi:hypothetical protein
MDRDEAIARMIGLNTNVNPLVAQNKSTQHIRPPLTLLQAFGTSACEFFLSHQTAASATVPPPSAAAEQGEVQEDESGSAAQAPETAVVDAPAAADAATDAAAADTTAAAEEEEEEPLEVDLSSSAAAPSTEQHAASAAAPPPTNASREESGLQDGGRFLQVATQVQRARFDAAFWFCFGSMLPLAHGGWFLVLAFRVDSCPICCGFFKLKPAAG